MESPKLREGGVSGTVGAPFRDSMGAFDLRAPAGRVNPMTDVARSPNRGAKWRYCAGGHAAAHANLWNAPVESFPCGASVELRFCSSAITKPVVYARIMIEMGSHLTKRIHVQSHNSFLDQSLTSHCVISQEPFLYSVRTLSSCSFFSAIDTGKCFCGVRTLSYPFA